MSFRSVLHVARIQFFFDNYGERAENIFHIEKSSSSAWLHQNFIDKIGEMVGWYQGYYAPLVNSEVKLDRIMGTDLTSEFAERYEYIPPVPLPGLADSRPLPQNVTACISSHTGGRGRSYNGRTYTVGMPAEFQIGGIIYPNRTADYVNAWNTLKSIIEINSYYMCIVSYQHNGAQLNPGVSYRITEYTCDNRCDSQRRRLPTR